MSDISQRNECMRLNLESHSLGLPGILESKLSFHILTEARGL